VAPAEGKLAGAGREPFLVGTNRRSISRSACARVWSVATIYPHSQHVMPSCSRYVAYLDGS
jgi:hypothetical protein